MLLPMKSPAQIRPNTRLIFGETLANPALTVFDIEKFAQVAHSHQIPLIVDNTFATPILCRPIEFGADIVIHSTTKYLDGHAIQVGGVIVDSGNFPWDNGKFPELVEPDESYHGVRYTRDFGKAAYITKARVQLMRDFGAYPAAINAFCSTWDWRHFRSEWSGIVKMLRSWQNFWLRTKKWNGSTIRVLPATPTMHWQKNICLTDAAA